ncbi:GL21369 [Drosophila persimilis]|uniref:Xenotropic and polytropic retrovirus receptor 1 n=3 Tax=pseudoobscura subgroup TaxID=32358 RepID=Q29E65_DROPS|nr:xenotropic and polytropic retrovirus receptor 1 [Drosophila pseudoobscura]XP_002027979.1 xenotropic and polytropic retrovirus receptor 1 isoform X1 [Drosophila persimilis]XP_017139217.1 xenotropic and polytropic retrovirus receptor 1 [Drosophila miranda]EDW37732.1 GL21369 [Drosophila persimilis]
MKFAEHLTAHITPEWRKQYISYEEMKAMLYAAIEQSPSAELVEREMVTRYFAKFDEEFFHYCDRELAKINTFYSEKMAEATRKYGNLRSELTEALEMGHPKKLPAWKRRTPLGKKNVPARKLQDLKLAFSEFYLGLILLQNYQNLNFTGFRKILKKHDKLLSVDYGARWRTDHVEAAHFYTNKDIDRLIQETEQAVTQDIEGGDRQRAMKRLRVPPLGEQQSPWTTFKVGLFSGAFVVLFITVVIAAMFYGFGENWRVGLRMFRAPFLIIECLFLWGVNVYGWRSSGVNHVLIFELDPRNHLSEQNIMEVASVFGVIWACCVLSYIFCDPLGIPQYAAPLILYILMVAFLLNPTRTFHHEARYWALRVLIRVIMAPFCFVNFADFWLADQLNSMVPAFLDIPFLICFFGRSPTWQKAGKDGSHCVQYVSLLHPIVAILPAYFRFAQCIRRYRDTKESFPHLVNAAKYATSFFVVIFAHKYHTTTDTYPLSKENPWFYCWITAAIFSSCYAYTWDIKMDWGLFDSKAGDNRFLREEIVYSSTWFYYFGIIEDLILRFSWTLSMSLIEAGYIEGDVMMTILSPLEVFRRFIWNYFRLENEHLNNVGKFRAVRDISVAPLDCSDQTTILRMMDETDGVLNRRRGKATGGKSGTKKNKQEQRLLLQGESIEDLCS